MTTVTVTSYNKMAARGVVVGRAAKRKQWRLVL
jgi:hypothetical protein